MTERPHEGGSYVKGKDGKLKRVEWTKPADARPVALPDAVPPAAPISPSESADATAAAKRKGKE